MWSDDGMSNNKIDQTTKSPVTKKIIDFPGIVRYKTDPFALHGHDSLNGTARQVIRPLRLARPRTPPFHGGDTGSNPVGDASLY